MNSACTLMRLDVVATKFDPDIARGAFDKYQPAEPLSVGALTAGGPRRAFGMGRRPPYHVAVQPPVPASRGKRRIARRGRVDRAIAGRSPP